MSIFLDYYRHWMLAITVSVSVPEVNSFFLQLENIETIKDRDTYNFLPYTQIINALKQNSSIRCVILEGPRLCAQIKVRSRPDTSAAKKQGRRQQPRPVFSTFRI